MNQRYDNADMLMAVVITAVLAFVIGVISTGIGDRS